MIRTAFAIAAALSALASPALACRPLESVIEEYRAEFGETPMWMGNSTGIRNEGSTILIISAPDGSWTMFKVDRRGACHIDHGYSSELLQRRGNV